MHRFEPPLDSCITERVHGARKQWCDASLHEPRLVRLKGEASATKTQQVTAKTAANTLAGATPIAVQHSHGLLLVRGAAEMKAACRLMYCLHSAGLLYRGSIIACLACLLHARVRAVIVVIRMRRLQHII